MDETNIARRRYIDSRVRPAFMILLGLTGVILYTVNGLEILIAASIIFFFFCKPLCLSFIRCYFGKDLNGNSTNKLKEKVRENAAIHQAFPKLESGNVAHSRPCFMYGDKRFYHSNAINKTLNYPVSLSLKRRSHGIQNVYTSKSQWRRSNFGDDPQHIPLSGGKMEFCRAKPVGLAIVESTTSLTRQNQFQLVQEDLTSKRRIKEMSPSARLGVPVAGSNKPLVLNHDHRWYEGNPSLSGPSGSGRHDGAVGYFQTFVSRNTGYVKRSLGLEPTWHVLRKRNKR